MDNNSVRSPKLREALKKMGNPYACEQVYEVASLASEPLDSHMRVNRTGFSGDSFV